MYHIPVLLDIAVNALVINPNGVYADVTFGGGGHSIAILNKLENGKLIAFDCDEDAALNAPTDKRFTFVNQNFVYLKNYLKLFNLIPIDGIIADLGISSHQIDSPERGFSHRFDSVIDLRMNKKSPIRGVDIINNYPEEKILYIIKNYGELINAYKITKTIIIARQKNPIQTFGQLKDILKSFYHKGNENKFFAKLIQAFRIEVNKEIDSLKTLLITASEVLKKEGRLVIISYNSIEDRIVKNFIKCGNFEGEIKKDIYGNVSLPFTAINKKVITPSMEEIKSNPRARSAKLRIAQKN